MIRAARITDRPALAELSERIHRADDAHRRSLGLPAPRAASPRISLGDLIPSWLPLRTPSLHLVLEEDGRILGSCRALEEPHRPDWVIVELDAAEDPLAADVRYRLLEALVEEGSQRGVPRYHAACSEASDNLELFSQLGFFPYAQEEILYRPPQPDAESAGERRVWPWRRSRSTNGHDAVPAELAEATSADAWPLFQLWTGTTPQAVARVEDYRAADWESVDHEAVVPRSSLTPIMRFGEVSSWLARDTEGAAGFVQHGSARAGPHYLRFVTAQRMDPLTLLRSGLRAVGNQALAAGMLTPVRTYELHLAGAAEEAGFEPVGRVTLLVRDVRARVRQPALVPAIH
jgi:hypothetical protein